MSRIIVFGFICVLAFSFSNNAFSAESKEVLLKIKTARELVEKKEYPLAIRFFSQALEATPDNYALQLELADVYWKSKLSGTAIRMVSKTIVSIETEIRSKKRASGKLIRHLRNAKVKMSEYFPEGDEIKSAQNEYVETLIDLAKSYTARKKYRAAKMALVQVGTLDPNNSDAHKIYVKLNEAKKKATKVKFHSYRTDDQQRFRLLREYKAPTGTMKAIDDALTWLASRQEKDGRWDIRNNGGERKNGNVGATALTALAFITRGHSPASKGKYQKNLKAAVNWMVSQQNKDGSFKHSNNYGNAMAVMMLAEAYGMKYKACKEAFGKGVEYLIKARAFEGGWDYGNRNGKSGRVDSSVTGWCFTALNTAGWVGVKIDQKDLHDGYQRFFERVIKVERDELGNINNARMAYDRNLDAKEIGGGSHAMQALGTVMRYHLSETPVDKIAEKLIPRFSEALKWRIEHMDAYLVYYAVLGSFVAGRDSSVWNTCNTRLIPKLLKLQRKEGRNAGSWPMKNHDNDDGSRDKEMGRALVTAMNVLSLQVYYRYPEYSLVE